MVVKTKQKLPKWATLDRQTTLIEMWSLHGNKCLQGHSACPHFSHYVQIKKEIVWVAKSVQIPCFDKDGLPMRDSKGNQLALTLNKSIPVEVDKVTVNRLYNAKIESLITNWKADDREQDKIDWELEQSALHWLNEKRYPLSGRFNAISQAIFADNQPLFYIQGLGISGLTFKPFAKVRIASSYMRLYIDLGDSLKRVSKNKKRKAIRYGKPLPYHTEQRVDLIVREAVKDYLAH